MIKIRFSICKKNVKKFTEEKSAFVYIFTMSQIMDKQCVISLIISAGLLSPIVLIAITITIILLIINRYRRSWYRQLASKSFDRRRRDGRRRRRSNKRGLAAGSP